MILSDNEIRKYVQDVCPPLIESFSEDNLQAASYDISMSGNITVLTRTGRIIDPTKDQDLDDMYKNIKIGSDGYQFAPGEYLLVELNEKVNIPSNLVAHIRPRTRFTRAGILVADQHCNPTYAGKLYIGLYNIGCNTILLWPGLKIAQFVFEELSSIPSEERWYKNKQNAAFHQETSFRGSRFGEVGWDEEAERLYQKVRASFNENQ